MNISWALAQDWHWPSAESAVVEVLSSGSASGGPQSPRPLFLDALASLRSLLFTKLTIS